MTTFSARKAPVVGAAFGAMSAATVAIAASLCCIGPAVLVLLGTGGALFVAKLAPYRPYLLSAGMLLLAVGFTLAYRPGGTCRNGTCSRGASRFVRWSLWGSTLVMAAAFALPYLVS